jgi:organic hydroperoxide reductase OsmC/OhrA
MTQPQTSLDKHSEQETQILYSTTVTVKGGNAGHRRASGIASSEDGQLAVELRLPKALGAPGDGTNPEQLFVAGYAACFHGAPSLLAARSDAPWLKNWFARPRAFVLTQRWQGKAS